MAKKQQEYGNDSIRQLKGADRVRELARMLSGVSENSESGLAHARTMLSEAQAYREKQ